jgi:ABC-type Na+ efflux pump permease subunit
LHGTGIVLRRDYMELRCSNAFRIMLIISAVIVISGSTAATILLHGQNWLSQPHAVHILELIMGLIIYFLPLVILMFFIWSFASLPVIKEKVNGNIESLLATPLKAAEVWMGKCLAIFLPGLVISVIAVLLIILSVNFIAVLPATGKFILPFPALVTGLLLNSLLFLGLLSLIILLSLAGNPDIAIAPSFLVGFGLMIGIPLGLATGVVNLSSWIFTLYYLALTVIMWIPVIVYFRTLNNEKVVLSSKGS